MKTLICSIAFAALLQTATPASAQPITVDAPDVVSAVVPAADLNLSSAAGRRTLMGRVNLAADRLCGVPVRPLHQMQLRNGCRAEVIASAEAQLRYASAAPVAIEMAGTR